MINFLGYSVISHNQIFAHNGTKFIQYSGDTSYSDFLSPRETRRLDALSINGLWSTKLLLGNSMYSGAMGESKTALVTAMKIGTWDATSKLINTAHSSNFVDLSPMVFPQTVANHLAGIIAIHYKINAYTAAIVERKNGDIKALELAELLLEDESIDRVLLVIGDSVDENLVKKFKLPFNPDGFISILLGKSDSAIGTINIQKEKGVSKNARLSSGNRVTYRLEQLISKMSHSPIGELYIEDLNPESTIKISYEVKK